MTAGGGMVGVPPQVQVCDQPGAAAATNDAANTKGKQRAQRRGRTVGSDHQGCRGLQTPYRQNLQQGPCHDLAKPCRR